MKKKVLIIYATYGTGHKAIANYVDDYFSNQDGFDTMKIDLLDYSKGALSKFTDKFYEFTMKHMPGLWEITYRITDNTVTTPIRKLLAKVVCNDRLKKAVLDFNPDLVIATHFTGASYIGSLMKTGELNCKLINVVTDYRAHRIWLDSYKNVDALVVNSVDEKRTLSKMGIDPKIIKTFGIPVSSAYTMALYDKEKLMDKFKLSGERPVILFYGGGGTGTFFSIPYLMKIIENRIDADVFFVCGKNADLKEKVESIVANYGMDNIHVLGFITNGPEYLMVSDFVVTKPGGITVTECLAFKKPMVLIKGNGGQEKDNYKYLSKKGFAVNAVKVKKFGKVVENLVSNPKYLEAMSKKMDKLEKSESMKKLFELAEELINDER